MTVWLLIIFVLLITSYIGYLTFDQKETLTPMQGMMIAMTLAMMVLLMIGMMLSAKFTTFNPTTVTIYAIVIGIVIGNIIGFPFGILAQLDGVLAGIMGGLMGPMTGLMISNSDPNLFIGFFTILYVLVALLIFQLIQKASKSSTSYQSRSSLFVFAAVCICLLVAPVIESNSFHDSQADSQKQAIQKVSYQQATIIVDENGYTPSQIHLKKNIPAKIHFRKETTSGCLDYLVIPDLHIRRELKMGDNLLSFTPKKSGTLHYTCGMGMYHGSLLIK